jgi:hypothetical protein
MAALALELLASSWWCLAQAPWLSSIGCGSPNKQSMLQTGSTKSTALQRMRTLMGFYCQCNLGLHGWQLSGGEDSRCQLL